MTAKALFAEAIGAALLSAAVSAPMMLATGGIAMSGLASLAAGLALVAATVALGHLSGAHFNPAVTLGLIAAGRFDSRQLAGYVGAQLAGALLAVGLMALALAGAPTGRGGGLATVAASFGRPGTYTMAAALAVETTAMALFLVIVVGATARRAPAGMAPVAIGFAFAALHLVALPVSAAALNPARAVATGLFAGVDALFAALMTSAASLAGGILGGVVGRYLQDE